MSTTNNQPKDNQDPKLSAVIFDCDGVLVNSFGVMHLGFCEVCRAEGLPAPDEKTFFQITHQPFIETFRDWGIKLEETKLWEIYDQHFGNHVLMEDYPGNKEMLAQLRAKEIPMAVISSASQERAWQKLKHFDLLPFSIVKGGHTDKAEAIRETCREFGLPPHEVLVIGDMDSDMRDSVTAGAYPVGIVGPFADHHKLRTAGAKQVASSHQELQQIILKLLVE